MAINDAHRNAIREIVSSSLLATAERESKQFSSFLNEIEPVLTRARSILPEDIASADPEKKEELLHELLASRRAVLKILDSYFPVQEEAANSNDRLSGYFDQMEEWVKSFPERNREFQHQDRFRRLPTDSTKIRFLKRFKRIFYLLSILPAKIGNLLRKVTKKKPRPITYWSHVVPERNLNTWFFSLALIEHYIPYFETSDRNILSQLYKVFHTEDSINLQVANAFIEKEGQDLVPPPEVDVTKGEAALDIATAFDEIWNPLVERFEHSRSRVGTIEKAIYRFNDAKVTEKKKQVVASFGKTTRQWKNAHRLVVEDWRLNLELYIAVYSTLINRLQTKKSYQEKAKAVNEKARVVREYAEKVGDGLKKHQSRSDLQQYLRKKKLESSKAFKAPVDELARLVISLNFPGLLDRLEHTTREVISELPEQNLVSKETVITGPVDDKAIEKVSPSELIYFEAFAALEKSLVRAKLELTQKLEKLRTEIESIASVVDFSIDTSLEVLDDATADDKQAIEVVEDSMDRINAKIADIRERFQTIGQFFDQTTDEAFKDFNYYLFRLTENEKVQDLGFRLTKAKAIANTAAIKNRAYKKLLSGTDKVTVRGSRIVKIAWARVKSLKNRLSRKIIDAPMSADVSDFLAESQSKVSQLPHIYQRLFSSEPVESKSMFTLRNKEIDQINNAFKKWDEGKYATTLILSEKGGGATSLINCFVNIDQKPYSVLRIRTPHRIHKEAELLDLFNHLAELKTKSIDELIEALRGYERKKVFVLEDLQRYFLRTVGGFDCLMHLQRIISSTNDNIFWIVNTTLHTWRYIHQSIQMGDIFEYKVSLDEMSVEQITDTIIGRNNVSGYSLVFEVPKPEQKKITAKLSPEQIQEIYQKKFFQSLHRYTKGNIALSLLFWQLSIQEVDEDTLYIEPFRDPDFGFLGTLEKHKIFVLQAAILHDGLTAEEYALLFTKTLHASQLQLLGLHEDGILSKRGHQFIVNPLIYRQTVNLLKLKNLLN